jgi:hypothetical protein
MLQREILRAHIKPPPQTVASELPACDELGKRQGAGTLVYVFTRQTAQTSYTPDRANEFGPQSTLDSGLPGAGSRVTAPLPPSEVCARGWYLPPAPPGCDPRDVRELRPPPPKDPRGFFMLPTLKDPSAADGAVAGGRESMDPPPPPRIPPPPPPPPPYPPAATKLSTAAAALLMMVTRL